MSLCFSLPHSAGPELRFPKSGEPDAIVNLGDDLIIECDGSHSDPEVYLIVITANGIEVDSSLSVTINHPQLSDTGTLYEFFSANSIGNTTVDFNLTVRGHPFTLILFAYTHTHTHSHMFTHTYTCTHTDKPDAVDNETIRHELLSLVVARITWENQREGRRRREKNEKASV